MSVSESAQLRQKGRVKDDVTRLGKTPKLLQHLWVLGDDFSKGFGFQLDDRTERLFLGLNIRNCLAFKLR